ncbi:hypothetical protein GCM10009640_20980 [Agrococcus citreus]|uniref:Signal peptidase I n=1 Tax=Agrococcus citreus TaxID=84643 RepID=A0ABN1Z0R6_9MICO
MRGLSAGLLLLVLGLGIVAVGVPAVTGSTPLSILTGSMTPTLPPGTLVVVKPTPVAEIQLGEVITFQLESGQPTLVTHRVIARSTDSASGEVRFTTQGDANDVADAAQVMPVQVQGTVWYSIPYLGWANQWVNGPAREWLVPIAAGALFCYAAVSIIGGFRARRRTKREGAATAVVREPARSSSPDA